MNTSIIQKQKIKVNIKIELKNKKSKILTMFAIKKQKYII